MTRPHRIRAYFALRNYEMRQCWKHFKDDALELWNYWRFRLEYALRQAWPFRFGAWVLSMTVSKDQGFGKFREKEDVMHLPVDHPVFDSKHNGLLTKEAVLEALKHVNVGDG